MRKMFTAAELAEMNLPGLPATERNIRRRATIEDWDYQNRSGRGGGKLYPVYVLPAKAREAVAKRLLKGSAPVLKTSKVDISLLSEQDQQIMEARAIILQKWDQLMTECALPRSKAADALVSMAKTGELSEEIAPLVPVANARSGRSSGKAGKQTLSRTSLYRWLKEKRTGGDKALAPKSSTELEIPEWAGPLLKLWASPQQPSLVAVMEKLTEQLGDEAPSYYQAYRFLKRLDPITVNTGRMGPRELKNLKAFKRRDVSELWPSCVYTADGHTFDAEVAHPGHGKPFRPEITTIIDVYTRRIVGWSVGLSENTWGTHDAIRKAFTECGICSIWYVDNGSGFKNDYFDDIKIMGLFGRLGVTKTHSLPYNSQARGIGERVHNIWVKAAKELPTYMGQDMDQEAKQRVFKITRKDIKEFGSSRLLIEWPEFVEMCENVVSNYNDRPHRSLPKVRDENTGKRRHMTPNEYWTAEASKADIECVEPTNHDIFRPYEKRQVRRGEIQLFNNLYFAFELEPYHGDDVHVGYDIHNPDQVWVRDLDGRFICTAKVDGNKTSYFPKSALEIAAEKRAKSRLRLVDRKREEIEQELHPDTLLEYRPEMEITPEQLQTAERETSKLIELPPQPKIAENGRPIFSSDYDLARWLVNNPDQVTPKDREHLGEMLRQPTFKMTLEVYNVDINGLRNLIDSDTNRGEV
ncbi:Mu transposase C-terminal domain-containing protein [Emcibacter sp.]|uniref:Mu transposase C-terminal domain-containing protein n=1 Tax=Emcibacter sp. TaxID=1979954 RepID=UPI002AA7D63D|nr:Mu transposase C-terminal domain-containing protein [Emcibacter sp.]